MSVSPPVQKERKARDLNPHGLSAARFSKPARQPVSGYPPYRVDPAGVEPDAGYVRGTLAPSVHASPFFRQRSGRGSNPVFRAYQGGVLPQHFQTMPVAEAGFEPAWDGF